MPELQVLNGALRWKTVRLDGARFLIGRKDGCHLVLQDGWVSREHTLIVAPRPGVFVVKDLGSENGTYLNGDRVTEATLKNSDVLRVGRTEMRFLSHGEIGAPTPSRLVEGGAVQHRTASHEMPTVEEGAEHERTTAEGDGRSAEPRIDLRERVRRLEKRVLELEQDNARFAAENAVLKRALDQAGLWDRAGQRPSTPAAPRPAVDAAGEPPTALACAWLGVGEAGKLMAAAVRARGRRRVRSVDADPRAIAALAEGLREDARGAFALVLCADLAEIGVDVLDAACGAAPGRVCGLFVAARTPDAGVAAKSDAGLAAVRRASEAGRLKGVVLWNADGAEERAAAAEAFDALLGLPCRKAVGGRGLLGAHLEEVLSADGFAVVGRAALDPNGESRWRAAALAAVDDGRAFRQAPASRARVVALAALIASEIPAADPDKAVRLESALGHAAEATPQARLRRGLHEAGTGTSQVVAFVGGLPFPERAQGGAR
ncbi:MAG TPA: FHA domain-containing protein [Planctomycetota bacterium]|nr:FHA domain-containing protein [Planctomycetota bacterium]